MPSYVKILQINLNRSRTAHDLLEETARYLQVDLCVLSEPNVSITRRKKLTGWTVDNKVDAALWWTDHNTTLSTTDQGQGDGYAWVTLENNLRVYSCHYSPNRTAQDFQRFLEEMEKSIELNNHRKIVVSGDFNAAATQWGSDTTTKRGQLLLEWMAQNGLTVLNDGVKPTFLRREQRSYIDLTLCDEHTATKTTNWTALDEVESLSDH